jgi:NADP-dependent 3-hydroxy acid dehydrogenase YdfG
MDSMKSLQHAKVKKLILDVTNDANVARVVETVMKEEGQLDLLINNAGVLAPGMFFPI